MRIFTQYLSTHHSDNTSLKLFVDKMATVKLQDTRIDNSKTNGHPTKTEINHKDENSTIEEATCIACSLAPSDEYETVQADGSVKIRFSTENDHASSIPAISVMEFMNRANKKWQNRPALKVERQGEWLTWTYSEYLKDVKTAAKAFIKVSSYSTYSTYLLFFLLLFCLFVVCLLFKLLAYN